MGIGHGSKVGGGGGGGDVAGKGAWGGEVVIAGRRLFVVVLASGTGDTLGAGLVIDGWILLVMMIDDDDGVSDLGLHFAVHAMVGGVGCFMYVCWLWWHRGRGIRGRVGVEGTILVWGGVRRCRGKIWREREGSIREQLWSREVDGASQPGRKESGCEEGGSLGDDIASNNTQHQHQTPPNSVVVVDPPPYYDYSTIVSYEPHRAIISRSLSDPTAFIIHIHTYPVVPPSTPLPSFPKPHP